MPITFPSRSIEIAEAFARLRREKNARQRDIAEQLHISEGELIAAHAGLSLDNGAWLGAERLRAEWPAIIAALEPLGEVMARTRNACCVHEKAGVYRQACHNPHVGLVLGGEIDLRAFYRQWAQGFAVRELKDDTVRRSLQFFDAAGNAVHQIFLPPQSAPAAYEALVTRFADDDQEPGMTVTAPPAPALALPDARIDVAGFRAGWAGLRGSHDFFALLKQYSVSRLQGLRLAEPRFVQQFEESCVLDLLGEVAREQVAIMAFVGNSGMIQIHSGAVHKILLAGPWINILDPRFKLRLREDRVASAWVVKKPTVDGLVTSVELFDARGDAIVMFLGARKAGRQECCEWRQIVDNTVREAQLCAA